MVSREVQWLKTTPATPIEGTRPDTVTKGRHPGHSAARQIPYQYSPPARRVHRPDECELSRPFTRAPKGLEVPFLNTEDVKIRPVGNYHDGIAEQCSRGYSDEVRIIW